MSIFSDCMSVGFSAIEDVAGESIEYRAGLTVLTGLTAVAEDKTEQRDQINGNRFGTEHHVQAFLIRASLLGGVVPAKGHYIKRASGKWYKVLNPSGGNIWEWSESHNTHYRIYAVEDPGP